MPSIDNLTPSSSLMLVRDSCDGIQVFMMKRAQKSNFGGIWVFPGGIIENQDKEIAEKDFCKGLTESDAKGILNNDNESLHYWIASLRETFEESGALIANREDNSVFVPTDDELGTLEKLRNDLLNGNISFMSILIQLNLKIDLSRLIYVSHWITPNIVQRFLPGSGVFNALSAGIAVGIMIIPTIASISDDALKAVPNSLRFGSLALGSTRRITAIKIMLPAALSGIIASFILGFSRAIGETMIVTIAGGQYPELNLDPRRAMYTITSSIVNVSLGDTPHGTTPYNALFALGITLFIMTFVLNLASDYVARKYRKEYE